MIRLLFVAVIATLLAKIGGALYYETRPFVLAHTQPLIPHVPDNGFPSDHTLLAFSSAFFLWPLNRRLAVITVILAFLIGLSRIMCLLHSPLDILASILFALIANIAAFVMERRFFSPRNAPQSVANG